MSYNENNITNRLEKLNEERIRLLDAATNEFKKIEKILKIGAWPKIQIKYEKDKTMQWNPETRRFTLTVDGIEKPALECKANERLNAWFSTDDFFDEVYRLEKELEHRAKVAWENQRWKQM